jgi:hypothetical protein
MWPKNTILFDHIQKSDFKRHPVWSWWDDDYDLLEPVEFSPYLPGNRTTLFVYTPLLFQDQSTAEAAIVFRQSDRWVYLIVFFLPFGRRFDYSRMPMIATTKQLRLLEKVLQKTYAEMSPAVFNTPYKFNDGTQLKGSIHI